jgi:hypothetical protein
MQQDLKGGLQTALWWWAQLCFNGAVELVKEMICIECSLQLL